MKKTILTISIAIVSIAILLVGFFIIRGKTYKVKNPVATIVIEGYEKPIKIELDPQSAPNAVANFIKLANSGFYNDYEMTIQEKSLTATDGKEAHLSNLQENPEKDYVYGIKGDFLSNDVKNYIRHEKGVITMERDDYSYFGYTEEGYNSANAKFSILTDSESYLNGVSAAFGKVIEGTDVLDAIAATRVDETNEKTANAKEDSEDKTQNVIKIKSITVDTFGIDYGMPQVFDNEDVRSKVNQIYQQYFSSQYSM